MPRPKDLLAKAGNFVHRSIFNFTKGKGLTGKLMGMKAVKLETTGRKSGAQRETMLTSPLSVGDDVVLVASWGGDANHPHWYLNILDNPEVKLTMDGREFAATARTASQSEKDELWPQVTAKYNSYAKYQTKTDRDIPLVICSPKG